MSRTLDNLKKVKKYSDYTISIKKTNKDLKHKLRTFI